MSWKRALSEYKTPIALGGSALLAHFGLDYAGIDEATEGATRFIPYALFATAGGKANVTRVQKNTDRNLTRPEKAYHFFKGAAFTLGIWKGWEYFGANVLPEMSEKAVETAKDATEGYAGQTDFPGSSPYEALGDWGITTTITTLGKEGLNYAKEKINSLRSQEVD